jgi:hypothetical protein
MAADRSAEVIKQQRRPGSEPNLLAGDDAEPGLNLLDDTLDEVGRGDAVHRHEDGAAQQAAPEGGDPFGAVFSPEQDGVAGSDAAGFELAGEAARVASTSP